MPDNPTPGSAPVTVNDLAHFGIGFAEALAYAIHPAEQDRAKLLEDIASRCLDHARVASGNRRTVFAYIAEGLIGMEPLV